MKSFASKIREYVPLFSLVMYALTIVSLIFYVIVLNSTNFADFFNYYLSAPTRLLMACVLVIFPFSIAEMLIILSPILLCILIWLCIKAAKKGKKASIRLVNVLLAIVCFIFVSFVWTYSSGYHTSTIDKKMNLDRSIDKQELYESYKIIVNELNSLADKIDYDETGASVMNYSYWELSSKICDAYDSFVEKYPVLHTFSSKIKPIMLSEPMTYTHISGIYSYMTGEANLNVNYPDFVVCTSAAHEMAHQRGIAREDECNFIAFAVLLESDDLFLRYSAYLDVYANVASALYKESPELFSTVKLDSRVSGDRRSYSEFFKKYEDSKASEIANSINNSYLQANGQIHGTKTYGMIVENVCAYLIKKTK